MNQLRDMFACVVVLVSIAASGSNAVAQQIYKCEVGGRVVFQDTPCVKSAPQESTARCHVDGVWYPYADPKCTSSSPPNRVSEQKPASILPPNPILEEEPATRLPAKPVVERATAGRLDRDETSWTRALAIVLFIGCFGALAATAVYMLRDEGKTDLSMLPEQFVVLDLETTGLDPIKHEIIEIGAVKVNRNSNSHLILQALIKPSRKIPTQIAQLTGITQEILNAEGKEIGLALEELTDFIGDLRLVIFNAKFDMGFLKQASKSLGIEIKNPVSCALKMARRAWPGLNSYKLANLANMGGLSSEGTHRSIKDCELTITVYMAAAKKLGSVE